MIEIAELWTYPVKSLPGVLVDSAEVGARGLAFDRHWMLVDEDGTFISQREALGILRFRVRVLDQRVEVWHPDHGCRVISGAPQGETIETHVWKADLLARLVDPGLDAWFSAALGRDCRLVALCEESERWTLPEYGRFPVSFADGMPILVLSEASVEDISRRTGETVPANRFRANIVLRGTEPYEEDGAARLTAGNVRLVATKRCGRCIVVCTDQETGERSHEPLKTLAGYRLYGQNACMGMYYAPESFGTIAVGQQVALAP